MGKPDSVVQRNLFCVPLLLDSCKTSKGYRYCLSIAVMTYAARAVYGRQPGLFYWRSGLSRISCSVRSSKQMYSCDRVLLRFLSRPAVFE